MKNEAQKNCGFRLPVIGSIMYVDFAGKHNIDMHSELLACMATNQVKKFSFLKYGNGDTYISITIAPYGDGAIITSENVTEHKMAETELAKHREHLEELVKERTQELQDKNKELDNAIRVFAGRELTIRDLRNVISKLKEGK